MNSHSLTVYYSPTTTILLYMAPSSTSNHRSIYERNGTDKEAKRRSSSSAQPPPPPPYWYALSLPLAAVRPRSEGASSSEEHLRLALVAAPRIGGCLCGLAPRARCCRRMRRTTATAASASSTVPRVVCVPACTLHTHNQTRTAGQGVGRPPQLNMRVCSRVRCAHQPGLRRALAVRQARKRPGAARKAEAPIDALSHRPANPLPRCQTSACHRSSAQSQDRLRRRRRRRRRCEEHLLRSPVRRW